MGTTRSSARSGVGPGRVLEAISSGQAQTRSALVEATGLSRPTVSMRIDALLASGLVLETEQTVHSGGRPAKVLTFNTGAAVVVGVDVGEQRSRVMVCDLTPAVIDERVVEIVISDGPESCLDRIIATVRDLLTEHSIPEDHLAGLGIGLPAPVDFGTGRTVGWSVMAGWEGFDVRGYVNEQFNAAVLIDNDVNLLTLAEHRIWWPDERHLLYVKAGTGIGSGMIVEGHLNRGSLGAAGDIGHAHLAGYGDPACRCGNRGCVESLVGGWALARDLRANASRQPTAIHDARDVVDLVGRGDSEAIAAVRDAGRLLGESVAFATSLLNPAVIVLGGMLAGAGDHLIAGVRELVYQRSLPLATKKLQIVGTRLGEQGGALGGAILVRDAVLGPDAIDAALTEGRPIAWYNAVK